MVESLGGGGGGVAAAAAEYNHCLRLHCIRRMTPDKSAFLRLAWL
jgi:hypothetical protein